MCTLLIYLKNKNFPFSASRDKNYLPVNFVGLMLLREFENLEFLSGRKLKRF